MGFFSRKERLPVAFPRTSIRHALVASLQQDLLVIHSEASGQNFIKLNVINWLENDPSNWKSIRLKSRGAAEQTMHQLLEKPAKALEMFDIEPDFVRQLTSWDQSFGFSDLLDKYSFQEIAQMMQGERDFPEDQSVDIFSLGNFLAEKLDEPKYIPLTVGEVFVFWGFLQLPSMSIGKFGNFKFVLKRLTDLFEAVAQKASPEVVSALAGCLGSGYGQVEGYLSKGNISPQSYLHRDEREFLTLRFLPEFGGNAYPSLRTAQFLSRKGLRILTKIEQEFEPLAATRFKVNLLAQADVFDESSARFSEYQLLVNHIIFGDSGLSRRDRSGRKMLLSSRELREQYSQDTNFIEGLSESQLEVYRNWLPEGLAAKNPLITHFGFGLSKLLKIDFPWTDNAFQALGDSSDDRVQQAIVQEIERDLNNFFKLDLAVQPRFLSLLEPQTVANLFELRNHSLNALAKDWALDFSSKNLTSGDIIIARALLPIVLGSEAFIGLLINAAKYSQLEPFDDWEELLSDLLSYPPAEINFLELLGAEPEKQGIFDVLEAPSKQLFDFFAITLLRKLEYNNLENQTNLLGAALEARSSDLRALVVSVAKRLRIPEQWLGSQATQFFNMDVESQSAFLRGFSAEVIAALFKLGDNSFEPLATKWAADFSTQTLTDGDFSIAKAIMARFGDRTYRDTNWDSHWLWDFETVAALLLNLVKHSQLDPLDEWKAIIGPTWLLERDSYPYVDPRGSIHDYLRLLGADSSKRGIFDLLKAPKREALEYFAFEFGDYLVRQLERSRWDEDIDAKILPKILTLMLEARSPSLQAVGRLIITDPRYQESLQSFIQPFENNPDLPLLFVKDAIEALDDDKLLRLMDRLGTQSAGTFWRKNGTELEETLRGWTDFAKFFWKNIEKLSEFVLETFISYKWLPGSVYTQISPSSIARLTERQSQALVQMLGQDKSLLNNHAVLRAILIAPSSKINEYGAAYVKEQRLFADFWLMMLESNLPITTKAAYDFLSSQDKEPDFLDNVLMVLDSNNKRARKMTLKLISEKSNPKLVEGLVQKLVENRNSDVWHLVRDNLAKLKEQSGIRTFTKRVFLSRRQARAEKEKIKVQLEKVIGDIGDALESEVLLRMSLSSVSRDREWALRQIGLGHLKSDEVLVETSWTGSANV